MATLVPSLRLATGGAGPASAQVDALAADEPLVNRGGRVQGGSRWGRRSWRAVAGALLAGLATSAVVLPASGAGANPAHVRGEWSRNRHGVLLSVHTTRRQVALTFDDGPDPTFTPRALAVLHRAGATATFFDEGRQVLAYPALAHAEVDQGSEIANHTFDHPHLPLLSTLATAGELQRTSDAFRAVGVPEAPLFRPPYGAFAGHNLRAVRLTGKLVVGWNLCVEKALRGRSSAAAVRLLLAHVHPGSIILAHDAGGLDRTRTMAALPALLDGLRQRGYEVTSVGKLLQAA